MDVWHIGVPAGWFAQFTYSFTGAPGSNALPHSTREACASNKAATAFIMDLLRNPFH